MNGKWTLQYQMIRLGGGFLPCSPWFSVQNLRDREDCEKRLVEVRTKYEDDEVKLFQARAIDPDGQLVILVDPASSAD